MTKARKPIRGGYRFANFRGAPSARCAEMKAADRLVVPLASGPGIAAKPVVAVGDEVNAGKIIAIDDESISNPVHAPAAATIEKIDGESITLCVSDKQTVAGDGIERIAGASPEWKNLNAAAIRKLIYLSGSAGAEPDGLPTEWNSAEASPDNVENIVVKILPDDIINPDPEVVLDGDRFGAFVSGLRILARAYPSASVSVAISRAVRRFAERTEDALRADSPSDDIRFVVLSDRYPQSQKNVLISSVTGKPISFVQAPHKISAVVLDYQTVFHVANAVIHGLPVISRRIAVGGSCIKTPEHVDVLIGTPVESVLHGRVKEGEGRVILDSLMTGPAAGGNAVVRRTTSGIYRIPEAHQIEPFSFGRPGFIKDSYSNTFFSKLLPFRKETNTNIHGEQRACLSCSFCADICPVGILPSILHRYVERELISETLVRIGMYRCVECNLCTYVCPSKIPLSDLIKKGKQLLREEGFAESSPPEIEKTATGTSS